MKTRDIIIGVVVLALLAAFVYYRQNNKKETPTVPPVVSNEKTLEDKFKIQIPDDVDKADLKATEGGNGSGIATRDFKNSKFTSSVLADLPAPATGEFYQAWLVKGDTGSKDYAVVSLGKLQTAKGGYLLDYSSKADYPDYKKVIVTSEKKLDNTPEKTVLEGSF